MKKQLKKIVNIFSRAELGILPASLAYYLFLAIIPILTIIVLIASSFNISLDRLAVIINDMLPQKVAAFILEIINGRGFDTNVGMFNLIAFVVSTNGTYAIIKSANSLYNVKNSDIVKFSYFEIKIKMNMDEEDIDRFLKCSKIILEDQGYQVYQLGEKYNFEGEQRKVEDNEFLVAIPNNTVKM